MKFKVGDRVKVLHSQGRPELDGQHGIVLEDSDSPCVKFEGWRNGHTAGGRSAHDDVWSLSFPDIELVPADPLGTGVEPLDRGNLAPTHSQAVSTGLLLPTGSAERKNIPLMGGLFDYFASALIAVARISKKGNDKHNPGQPLHWSRDKSTDHLECIPRHLLDWDKLDEDGEYHIDHLIWRACALSQLLKEANGAPKARGAK